VLPIEKRDGTDTPDGFSEREEAADALSRDDRLWLADRLVEYSELLDFLRTN
jgi:hypothetical protein